MVSALTPIGFVLNSKKKIEIFSRFFSLCFVFRSATVSSVEPIERQLKKCKQRKNPRQNNKWKLLKRHPGLRSYFLNFAHMSLIDFLTEEEIAFSPNSIVPKSRLGEEEKFSRAQHYCQELCYSPFLYHQSCVLVYFFSHITVPCIHLFISQ